jgi:hypothetical protein
MYPSSDIDMYNTERDIGTSLVCRSDRAPDSHVPYERNIPTSTFALEFRVHVVGGRPTVVVPTKGTERPLDTFPVQVHTRGMRPSRLMIPDARGHGASLRVTRHPEQKKVVLSHWRDGLCVASTPIELSEVSALIGVLADALGEAVDATAQRPPASDPRSPLDAVRRWLRPRLAQIVDLRPVREPPRRGPTGEPGEKGAGGTRSAERWETDP